MRIPGLTASSTKSSLRPSGRDELVASTAIWQSFDSARCCITQSVAEGAAAAPDRTAVVCGERTITYAGLERQSNQIAQCLSSMGVGSDVPVAICLPRSQASVITALAVLKAGGAYLPLDPEYPVERLAWMLDDAKPAVVVTRGSLSEHLRGPWETINLDSDGPQLRSYPGVPVDVFAPLESLAYIIYTSGSTGRPKGVAITHRGLLNLISWHLEAFDVVPADRATLLSSPAFDAAVWELWPYLRAGASVHIVDDAVRNNPETLRDWLISRDVTIAFVPTPLAERMISLKWPRKAQLRLMLTGADTLRKCPPSGLPFKLVNNYGPTECTVVSTSGVVPPDGKLPELPTIGRPISNVQIHILDERLQHVPDGVTGEIYIGGPGVGRGYINAPELNLMRFVPNPFDSAPDNRLYRTGDLGRYLPDGEIAFLGRIDNQIKIRGYRIEPGDVAAALSRHPMISENVVVSRDDHLGEKQLVAYVVTKEGRRPTDQILKDFLTSILPEYMIPAIWVRIDRIPITSAGKIDRAALPPPDSANSLHVVNAVAPGTRVERKIAEIITQLLGVATIGVEDNFFMLGGHSLLGVQLITRLRTDFGVEIPLRNLFKSPTIADLASEVQRSLDRRMSATGEEKAEHSFKTASGCGGPDAG